MTVPNVVSSFSSYCDEEMPSDDHALGYPLRSGVELKQHNQTQGLEKRMGGGLPAA
jgi:hypothetical protein